MEQAESIRETCSGDPAYHDKQHQRNTTNRHHIHYNSFVAFVGNKRLLDGQAAGFVFIGDSCGGTLGAIMPVGFRVICVRVFIAFDARPTAIFHREVVRT